MPVLTRYICTTCGIQYAPTETRTAHCKICTDERQYVNPKGQSWTTLAQLNNTHTNIIEQFRPDLYAIYTAPAFGIGQRAHLLIKPTGNILWDCITNLDAQTIAAIEALGGVKAIALSHPHYYSTMNNWSRAFGNAPVYVHERDRQWVCDTDENIIFWPDEMLELFDDVALYRCGGHFDGGAVLHDPVGDGSILAGDVIQVSPDLRTVSFMYSYPNLIPLPKRDILFIRSILSPLNYDAVYGAFGRYIETDAQACMAYSIDRYLKIFEE